MTSPHIFAGIPIDDSPARHHYDVIYGRPGYIDDDNMGGDLRGDLAFEYMLDLLFMLSIID